MKNTGCLLRKHIWLRAKERRRKMKYGMVSLALKNMAGRKKKIIVNGILLMISMLIILLSQTAINAYQRYIYATGVEPKGYSCLYVGTQDIEQCYETMKSMYENDERISMMGISYSGGSSDVVTEEINELFREELYFNLESYFNIIERYMEEPVEKLGEYDIILPQYVFDTDYAAKDITEDVPYVDMKQFIGTDIELEILKEKYTFHIVGVYDNVHAQVENEAYIAYDTIKKIFSPSVDEERENGAIRFVEYCYMWVENLEDRDVIEEEVNAYYKSKNPVEPHHVGYESHLFEGYLEYIEFLGILGTAIGVLIWCWAFVSILLVTIKDVGQRMQEYAVLKSVGYMSKQIYKILAVELSILTGGSLTFSVILTGIAIKIGNYYVKNNMNPFWQTLKFRLSVQSLTGCVVLIVITTTVVLTLAVRKIKTMCVIKELKG